MSNDGNFELAAAGDREIVFTRTFDAPRDLVFAALTTPDLVRRWLLGPDGYTMPVCEIDLTVGGRYRYAWARDGEVQFGVSGTYEEIAAPARLVHSETFEPAWYPGGAVVTTRLADLGGRTGFRATVTYESREARDAVLTSPMEHGARASYDRLAALLAAETAAG